MGEEISSDKKQEQDGQAKKIIIVDDMSDNSVILNKELMKNQRYTQIEPIIIEQKPIPLVIDVSHIKPFDWRDFPLRPLSPLD